MDKYVEAHDEDRKELLGFYEQMYSQSTPEEFTFRIFRNTYDFKSLRLVLASGMFVTSLAAVALSFLNPFLPLLLSYDVYLLG